MEERTDSTLSCSPSISLVLMTSSVSANRLAWSRRAIPTSASRPNSMKLHITSHTWNATHLQQTRRHFAIEVIERHTKHRFRKLYVIYQYQTCQAK